MTRELGLDRPLPVQYARFVGELPRGERKSFRSDRPVVRELAERAGASVELVTLSLLVAVAIGIPLGVLLAVPAAGGSRSGCDCSPSRAAPFPPSSSASCSS